MANLREISELVFRKMFPEPGDDAKLKKAEIFATAKLVYATAVFIKFNQDRQNDDLIIPSQLINRSELTVIDGYASLSDIEVAYGIPGERWAISIPGMIKSSWITYPTHSKSDMPAPRFIPMRDKIYFPEGAPKKVDFIYAGVSNIDESYDVPDDIGMVIMRELFATYEGTGREDVTNNENAEA